MLSRKASIPDGKERQPRPNFRLRQEETTRVKASPAPEPAKKYPNCSLPVSPGPVSGKLRGLERKNQAKAPAIAASPKKAARRRSLTNSSPRIPLYAAANWNMPQEAQKTRMK